MTDYTKLVEALRRCAEPGTIIDECDTTDDCPYSIDGYCGDCMNNLVKDAADAIEDLQAQLPKLGKWQKAKPHGVVTYSDGYAECSHCHEAIWLGWGMNFCPNCGTQNKIIDPDDYDGAKMEVQDG